MAYEKIQALALAFPILTVAVAEASRPELPSGPLTTDGAAAVIGALLPERAIVVDEANTSGLFIPAATAGAPRHDWLCLTGGSIGVGLPLAVGAAVACPDRPVLALQADARILPVPFQGTPAAVAALIGGSIRAIVDGYSVLQPQAASGRLRILAILADQVYPGLENYPLSTRTLPDTAAMGWFGVYAKTGTDPAVVQRVNTDLNAALATPDVVTRLRDLGTYPRPGSPAALDAFTQAEIRFWAEKLDKLGIKPE